MRYCRNKKDADGWFRYVKYLLITFLLFFSSSACEEVKQLWNDINIKPGNHEEKEPISDIISQLLNVYESSGEKGLRDFVKSENKKIAGKFILYLAENAIPYNKEEWLRISLIAAEEKKDEKLLADVYCKMGEYFRYNSDKVKGIDYLDRALVIYRKLTDDTGQGNVYLEKGTIHHFTGNIPIANEMYDKSLSFYKKAGYRFGQACAYQKKGEVYFWLGEYRESIQMYKKALFLFEALKDQKAYNDVLLDMGKVYFYSGDYVEAERIYQKVLQYAQNKGEPGPLGMVYWLKGEMYTTALGKYNKGLQMYEKALYYFKIVGLNQDYIYYRIGAIYFETGKNEKAIKMYDKALHLVDNIDFKAHIYTGKGDLYLRTGENSNAVEMYDKAISLYKKMGSLNSQAGVYSSKGYLYSRIGDNPKAIKMYRIALNLYEKIKNPGGQVNVFSSRGDIYHSIGENSKAIEMYNKLIDHNKNVNDPLGMGYTYVKKGNVYVTMGEKTKAEDMYKKAMVYFNEKETNPFLLGRAFLYHGMGYLYYGTCDNLRALKMYKKASALFDKTSNLGELSRVYYGKYALYSRLGDRSKARIMLENALEVDEKMGNVHGQGNAYLGKGTIKLMEQNYTEALEMYLKALQFHEKAESLLGLANAYSGIGDSYFFKDNTPKASEMYEKALSFFRKAGSVPGQGSIYKMKGAIYLKAGDYSNALEMYDAAIEMFKEVKDIEQLSFVFADKAKVLAKLGEKKQALDLFEKMVANLEKVRTQTVLSEMKMSFMRKNSEVYEDALLFLLRNKYKKRAFQVVESMKARVFLERLAEGMEKVDKGISQGLKKRRDKLIFKLSAQKKNLADAINRNDQEKLKKLSLDLDKIEIELENLSLEIREKNPRYASVFHGKLVELKNLQQKVLKKDEILLEYFISRDGVYLFLVSREDFRVEMLNADEKEIADVVKDYLKSIPSAQPTESRIKRNKRIKHLEYLYSFLLKPVEKEIEGKRLIFAPDGQLTLIPFEALVSSWNKKTRKPVFLIEKNSIKYIQSASVLAFLRSRGKSEVIYDNLVAFGDPVYDNVNFKMGRPEKASRVGSLKEKDELKDIYRSRYVLDGGTFDRLTGSSEEVRTIAGLFEKMGQKPVLYLRDKATEKNARSPEMNHFGYIHFGCHGLVGDEFQSLVLSQDIPGETEDGFLSFDEIMNCDYNAQLVVLSACKTNLGKEVKGEGLIGLTRAVMYAGTPAVVASLWKVEDAATKDLMVRFYKNLLEKGMEKSEALRQAKLELLKNKKYSSPIYWSAFVMYGE